MNQNNQVEKKDKKTIVFIILIIILLLIIVGLMLVIATITSKDNKTNNENKDNNVSSANNSSQIDDSIKEPNEEILQYLNYVPILEEVVLENDEFYDYNLDAYSGKKVTVNDLNEKLLLSMSYNYANETKTDEKVKLGAICGGNGMCSASKYVTLEDMNNQLKKMYNVSNIVSTSFQVSGGLVTKTEKYWAVLYSRGSSPINKVNKFVDYKETDDELIIREKAGFVYDEEGLYSPSLYTDTAKTNKVVDNDDIYKTSNDLDISYPKEKFEQNIDKFNTFKHTFKKNENGDYYWYSTEMEK